MASGDIDQEDLLGFGNFNLGEDDADDPSAMSLVDHLEELRWRILKALIAIVVGSLIAFVFRDYIIHFLEAPLPRASDMVKLTGGRLVVTGLTEGFTVYLLISFACGVILSLPILLYQTWAFIEPGLYDKERKHAVPFILIGVVLFCIGVSIGYIVLRFPVEWLVEFASSSFAELISAGSYFTFVAFFILAFGLVFELPLVLTFLAQVGLVTSDTLKKRRASSHIGMWIASTFLTPGADIYSPIILGASMSFLYELTIIFIRFIKK